MSKRLRPLIAAMIGVFLVLVTTVVTASAVDGQILYGSIVGTVTDAQRHVPGSAVTVVNNETNLTREAVSDSQGRYSLTNVLPGPYDVKVTLTGFREAVRTNVPVTIGQIARVDMPRRMTTSSGSRKRASRLFSDLRRG